MSALATALSMLDRHAEAAALVTRLMLEPPTETPPEVVQEIALAITPTLRHAGDFGFLGVVAEGDGGFGDPALSAAEQGGDEFHAASFSVRGRIAGSPSGPGRTEAVVRALQMLVHCSARALRILGPDVDHEDRVGPGDGVDHRRRRFHPADPADARLLSIPTLREAFGIPIGLSDHTAGIGVSVAAVALGLSNALARSTLGSLRRSDMFRV
mgnify:CR=1 FL=1